MISLIHPSRGRHTKAYHTANEWLDSAGCYVQYLLSIDSSDPEVEEYNILFADYPVFINDNKSVVEATNKIAKIATGDILIYLSDDFRCPDNWGLSVMKEFEGEDRPLLLKVDDQLQKFHVPVLTIPIMNRKLYERLGYFWHPEYKSMWVDCDLYETVRRIGAMKFAEHLKFPHEHPSNGKADNDETYTRSASNWTQGENVFKKRRALGFPI